MRIVFLIFVLLLQTSAHSQVLKKRSVELEFQIRREKQADYITRFGTVSYQNALQLHGTSFGANVGYSSFWKRSWLIKPSIGYYKFAVDKIVNHRIPARPGDPSSFRPIDYNPDTTLVLYATNQYHYNNFSLGFAFGRVFQVNRKLALTTDFSFTYLGTFSQRYKVRNGYATTNAKSLGYILDYRAGVERKFGNFYLASNIIVPVYKNWKKDEVFLENPGSKIETWFGGYGLSVAIGKYLK